MVIRISVKWSMNKRHGKVISVICKLCKVVPQVMFVEGVLTHAVEQRNFKTLFVRQGLSGVIALAIFPVDFLGDVNHLLLCKRVLRIDD